MAPLLGYEIGELTARPLMDFIHPDDLEATQRTYEGQTAVSLTKMTPGPGRCACARVAWRCTGQVGCLAPP